LSDKIVGRDMVAIEAFANTYLANLPESHSLRDIELSDLTTYLVDASTTMITGFKRFSKFMAETGRMDWGEADNSLRWLREQ